MRSTVITARKNLAFAALAALACASAALADPAATSRPYPKGFKPPIPSLPGGPKGVARPLPFFDNVEGGANGWQLLTDAGFWHLVTSPNSLTVSPQINPTLVELPDVEGRLPAAFSGSSCWWYGENATGTFIGADFNPSQSPRSGGTSVASNFGNLYSPPLDLSGAASATLSFRTWWEIEGVDVQAYDLMTVFISVNGGSFAAILPGTGRINPGDDVNGDPWRPYSSGGLGQVGQWIQAVFDLTPYVGGEAVLAFQFSTGDAAYNGFRGWFIDDISVTATAPPAPSIELVSPAVGQTNDLVNVIGGNFVNGAQVQIGGVDATESIVSSDLAHVFVPFLSAGLYDVRITNPNGQSATLTNGFSVTSAPPPTISSVSPNVGPVSSETSITIDGFNFQPGASATIAGSPVQDILFDSSSRLYGAVPAGLPLGFQNLTVINPDSQADTLVGGFRVVIAQPVITLHPRSQSVNVGQNVAFFVENIGDAPFTYQWFKDLAPLNGETGTMLMVQAADSGDAGGYLCRVSNAGGSADSLAAALTVFDPAQPNACGIAGNTMPPAFFPGQEAIVGFTILNTSPVSWSQTQGYALGVLNDPNNIVQGLGGGKGIVKQLTIVDPKAVVAPTNGVHQFVGTVKAPDTPGDYMIDVQMIENNANPFGPPSSLPIKVIPASNQSVDWEVFE